MPQPTSPASVMMVQYWPLCQRLLMPMAQPFSNWIGRAIVRGRGSFMVYLLALNLGGIHLITLVYRGPSQQATSRSYSILHDDAEDQEFCDHGLHSLMPLGFFCR